MNSKTLIAGLAFIGLVAVAVLLQRTPEKGAHVGEGPRPVAKLKEGEFDTLVITKEGKSTTLVRKSGDPKNACRVTAPLDYPADLDQCKDAFTAITELNFGSIVTDQPSKHKEFEVDDAGLRVQVKSGDKALADLRIGKVAGNTTMVRIEGKPEVWQGVGSLKWKLDRDPTGWRDKAVSNFDQAAASRIVVASADGARIVLEKGAAPAPAAAPTPEGGEPPAAAAPEWKIKESTLKIDDLDTSVATGIVNAASQLRANDFADGVKLEEVGLASPRLSVTVETTGGEKNTILIGTKKADGDEYYVKKEGGDQVFLMKKYGIDALNKRPVEFRDKTICNVSTGDMQEVTVTHDKDSFTLQRSGAGDSDWKLTRPKGDLDSAKASAIVGAFSDWKAERFAEDASPTATGLGKPTATIVAKGKGKGCTLKVGSTTENDTYIHVQPTGSKDVYLLPKWSLDRVLVKLDDLKKAAS